MLGNSWVAAQFVASQEGLSSMSEWVIKVSLMSGETNRLITAEHTLGYLTIFFSPAIGWTGAETVNDETKLMWKINLFSEASNFCGYFYEAVSINKCSAELEIIYKEAVMTCLKFHSGICMDGLTRTTKDSSQDNRCAGQELYELC
jgi:hypothetical protein